MTRIPLFVLALLGVSCGRTLPQAAKQDRAPVLGHLVCRSEKVTIHAMPEGPRFTVRDKNGRLVVQDLSAAELRARHPALYRSYEQGHALDASVALPAPEPQRYR